MPDPRDPHGWDRYRPLDFLPELRMIVCQRCESPLLDSARARRKHDEHHAAIDSALGTLAATAS